MPKYIPEREVRQLNITRQTLGKISLMSRLLL